MTEITTDPNARNKAWAEWTAPIYAVRDSAGEVHFSSSDRESADAFADMQGEGYFVDALTADERGER